MGNFMGGSKDKSSCSSDSSSESDRDPLPPAQQVAQRTPQKPVVPVMSPSERCAWQLGEIEKKIEEILAEVERTSDEFFGNTQVPVSPQETKRTLYLLAKAEEDFMQQLISCDNCEVPDEEWRGKRRVLIQSIQNHQSTLDKTQRKVQEHVDTALQQSDPPAPNPATETPTDIPTSTSTPGHQGHHRKAKTRKAARKAESGSECEEESPAVGLDEF